MFKKKTVRDVDVSGKVVLLRADYNVPLENGRIVDDLRVRASIPTIEYLLTNGVKRVIIISHLGRPSGPDESFSLRPVYRRLQELLGEVKVGFAEDLSGVTEGETGDGADGEGESGGGAAESGATMGARVVLVENLRFFPGEKENDVEFARELVAATGAEVFVQDGFGVSHRETASTAAITKLLPAVAGLLLEKEVTTLTGLLQEPKRPFFALIGGAKVADKAPLIEKLATVADDIFVGGKIAADGYAAPERNKHIHVARQFKESAEGQKLDVADEAGDVLAGFITDEAATVLWNGTFGKVEEAEFARNSRVIAEAIGRKPGLTSVICGGDTTAFVENLQKSEPELKYTLISTGGGAALALLAGEPLPGVENLEEKRP